MAQRGVVARTNLFINLQLDVSFAGWQSRRLPLACTSTLIPAEESQKIRLTFHFNRRANGVTLHFSAALLNNDNVTFQRKAEVSL